MLPRRVRKNSNIGRRPRRGTGPANTGTVTDSFRLLISLLHRASLPYRCDPRVDRNVLRMRTRCLTVVVKLDIHARPEDQAVCGPPKVEHSDLIALPDALPF